MTSGKGFLAAWTHQPESSGSERNGLPETRNRERSIAIRRRQDRRGSRSAAQADRRILAAAPTRRVALRHRRHPRGVQRGVRRHVRAEHRQGFAQRHAGRRRRREPHGLPEPGSQRGPDRGSQRGPRRRPERGPDGRPSRRRSHADRRRSARQGPAHLDQYDGADFAYYKVVRSTDATASWPLGAGDTLVAAIDNVGTLTYLDCPGAGTFTYEVFAVKSADAGYAVLASSNVKTVTVAPAPPRRRAAGVQPGRPRRAGRQGQRRRHLHVQLERLHGWHRLQLLQALRRAVPERPRLRRDRRLLDVCQSRLHQRDVPSPVGHLERQRRSGLLPGRQGCRPGQDQHDQADGRGTARPPGSGSRP